MISIYIYHMDDIIMIWWASWWFQWKKDVITTARGVMMTLKWRARENMRNFTQSRVAKCHFNQFSMLQRRGTGWLPTPAPVMGKIVYIIPWSSHSLQCFIGIPIGKRSKHGDTKEKSVEIWVIPAPECEDLEEVSQKSPQKWWLFMWLRYVKIP